MQRRLRHRRRRKCVSNGLKVRGKGVHVYVLEVLRLNSADFGLPQARLRIFMVCVRRSAMHALQSTSDFDAFFRRFASTVEKMKIPSPGLRSILLDNGDAAIVAELQRREEIKVQGAGKQCQHGKRWVVEHMEFCRKRSIPWPIVPRDAVERSRWFQVLPEREQELLCIAQHSLGNRIVDLSQSVQQEGQQS